MVSRASHPPEISFFPILYFDIFWRGRHSSGGVVGDSHRTDSAPISKPRRRLKGTGWGAGNTLKCRLFSLEGEVGTFALFSLSMGFSVTGGE